MESRRQGDLVRRKVSVKGALRRSKEDEREPQDHEDGGDVAKNCASQSHAATGLVVVFHVTQSKVTKDDRNESGTQKAGYQCGDGKTGGLLGCAVGLLRVRLRVVRGCLAIGLRWGLPVRLLLVSGLLRVGVGVVVVFWCVRVVLRHGNLPQRYGHSV